MQQSATRILTKEYTLNIPGRIRMKISILKNNELLCRELIEKLTQFSGVILASANHYTSKLLVIYDSNRISQREIENIINSFILNKLERNKTKNIKDIDSNNTSASLSKVIKADFRQKRVLTASEFVESRNVLSNEYKEFNKKALLQHTPQSQENEEWHTFSVGDAERNLQTNTENGLDMWKVEQRLKKYGLNEFQKEKKKSFLSMLANQFDGFIIKLLLGASGVSVLLGHVADAITILAIIGAEALLGVWQEHKAEKSLESLKQISTPTAHVIREGRKIEIASSHVVPGDIITLETGNVVPADARIIKSHNLQVIESSLTGEPYPVIKQSFPIHDPALPLGDRTNMVYMGTSVVKGNGQALVVSTGMNTQMGKIAGMLHSSQQEKSPLQKDLDRLARVISLGCIGICGIITLGGILGGHPLTEMLATGVSLAVGAIPEGLTTVLAISLAFGAQRMARKNAIVKTLPAVETLSCTKVICTDKTGTLTKNEMTVKRISTFDKKIKVMGDGYHSRGSLLLDGTKIHANNYNDVKKLLTAAALCNNSEIQPIGNSYYNIKGDPTEAALLIAVEKAGIKPEDFKCYKREHEIPFDSETKKMIAVCSDENGEYHSFCKGAVDVILQQCDKVMIGDTEYDLSEEYSKEILRQNEEIAGNALRVLALAYKPLGNTPVDVDSPNVEEGMIFLGLIGMMDPPRAEVKEAIDKCHRAGIKVVMITGDHKETAASIAQSVNLLTSDGLVLTGEDVDRMSEEMLADKIDNVQVFARTCPEQKLKIVKAFKKKGYIVAMTGDGINDAPALKEAHIGIAMGKTGTDVTKDASSIILTDDNFETVVKSIEEGRTINRNIRKFVKYVLSGNFAEVLAIFLASVSGLPTPLIPAQILMLNLVTEGIPALSLGVDPPDKDIMDEPPRDPSKSIFDQRMRRRILSRGIATGLSTLGIFGGALYLTGNLVKARTMAYANLISCQMLHAFECSSMGVCRNRYLVPSVVISTGIMLASIYLPLLSGIFGTMPLNLLDWAAILTSALILSRLEDFITDLLYLAKLRNRPSYGV